MGARLSASVVIFVFAFASVVGAERRLNNLVSELVGSSSVLESQSVSFARGSEGWVFVSVSCKGTGTVRVVLDRDAVVVRDGAGVSEGMRYVAKGAHTVRVECEVP